MAASTGKVVNLALGTAAVGPAMTAIDATDGLYLPFAGASEKALIIIENSDLSNDTTVKVKKGDSYAAAPADLSLTVEEGTTVYLVVESAKYLITTGTNRGKIHFTDTAGDGKVGLINLP